MHIHHHIDQLPVFKNGIVTFGSFDGVHLGHVGIVEKMKELAAEIDGETIVVTFFPHPRQVIYPQDKSLKLLSTRSEKIRRFEETGIDHLVFCPFTIEFSQWHPDEYIEKFIIQKFHPSKIVIGYDHRFGLNRQGNIDYLRSYAQQGHFEVFELPQQMTKEIQVSSTRIRNYLQAADIGLANELLGHPYLISGIVVRGHQIGESLGYPTANIAIDGNLKLIPPDGIYAVRVIHNNRRYSGMMYIGTRPTVSTEGKKSIEVNIFNFNDDIYNDHLVLEIIKFLRPDQRFQNLEALKVQLGQDKVEALEYLNFDKTSKNEATILILNYNGRKHLENFMPGVWRFSKDFEITVADNGSTDDSLAFLEKNYPQVKIIKLAKNYGFAGGYNRAIKKVNSEYIILLNSDVEVTNQWANKLIDYIRMHPEIGAVQPKVKSYDRKSTFEYAGAAGGLVDKLGYPFCQGRILSEVEEDLGQYDQIKEIFWTTGAAMIIRKNLFEKVGGFDADFFAHMEEIDLCWRLKQFGYKMFVFPTAVVYHKGGGTLSYESPRKTYLNFRNAMSLILKNERGSTLLWLFTLRVTLDIIAGLRFLLVGEVENAFAVAKALSYSILHFPSTWAKRQKVLRQKGRMKMGPDNTDAGRYRGSIVWEFFIRGRRKYQELRYISNKFL
ncbi:MAG: bifunctional riboflavin kinase/FAD synthetase [Saprospiraceae bacterium]|nr:bifunctional riboflavin kinase/FAD synthetase [Saprospiraceae bacterium]